MKNGYPLAKAAPEYASLDSHALSISTPVAGTPASIRSAAMIRTAAPVSATATAATIRASTSIKTPAMIATVAAAGPAVILPE